MESLFDRHFRMCVLVACSLYLALSALYVSRLPLVMDEFAGAMHVHQLLSEVPYRDFLPYKTVLGYYVQLLPMLLTSDSWGQLMLIKFFMALLTTLALFAAAFLLARDYRKGAVVLATFLLVVMSTFLERSSALRVDMLTALVGLFSLLSLLRRRVITSGLLAGVSFLVSQKGVYFMFSGGLALGSFWLLVRRDLRAFKDALRFTAAALAAVTLYFVFWAVVSSPEVLYQQVFVKNRGIAFADLYNIRHYWFQTGFRNPYFWGVSLLSLGLLYARRGGEKEAERDRDWLLLVFGSSMFGLCLWHKQPWPYFFVLLLPTAYVLVVSFLDAELRRPGGLTAPALVILVGVGLVFPAMRIPKALARDNAFQHRTVRVAEQLLGEGESYLAGVSLLRTRSQPGGLTWLDAKALRVLEAEDPRKLIENIRKSRVKLVVRNYRIDGLPQPVLEYLLQNYSSFTGNILLYGPVFEAGTDPIDLLFGGRYRVEQKGGAPLVIDGRTVNSGALVYLAEGIHSVKVPRAFRMRFAPEGVEQLLDPRYREQRPLFDSVYTY